MAINLQKGQTIDLRKNTGAGGAGAAASDFDLSQVTIGLGWDVRKKSSGGLFGSLFGKKEEDYDLDAMAFLLDSNGKVASMGQTVRMQNGQELGLQGSDIIFFNNLRHPSGQIWLTGDNRTGAGDGDDEQIIVRLDTLDKRYQRIIFLVTIYGGRQKGQNFGMIDNAYIRAADGRGKEIAKYSLSGDATFSNKHSLVFAEAYRHNDTWKFRALGEPHDTDNFVDILRNYLYTA